MLQILYSTHQQSEWKLHSLLLFLFIHENKTKKSHFNFSKRNKWWIVIICCVAVCRKEKEFRKRNKRRRDSRKKYAMEFQLKWLVLLYLFAALLSYLFFCFHYRTFLYYLKASLGHEIEITFCGEFMAYGDWKRNVDFDVFFKDDMLFISIKFLGVLMEDLVWNLWKYIELLKN